MKSAVVIAVFSVLILSCTTQPVSAQVVNRSLVVYDEGGRQGEKLWHPGGWMPDGKGISFSDRFETNPHGGQTCIQVGYRVSEKSWVGIYWLYADSWGEEKGPNLYEILGISKEDTVRLTFWARGENGGERVEFKVGGMTAGKYPDSIKFPVTTQYVSLSTDWTQFSIDLTEKNLEQMSSAFCWVSNRAQNHKQNEIWFYLDDIQFEVGTTTQ